MAHLGRRRDSREKIPTTEEKDAIMKKIAVALLERHNMILDGDNIDGVPVGVRLKDETSGSSWNCYYTGKVRVQLGHSAYNAVEHKGFPQKKDGTHSYDKIADSLATMKETAEAYNKARANSQSKYEQSKALIKELAEEHGVSWYSLPLEANSQTGRLTFKVSGITEAQARVFVQCAATLDLIKG